MSVLVTGASGWVGSALCSELSRRGIAVVAPVRRALPSFGTCRTVLVPTLDGTADYCAVLPGIDTVVHLASRVHVMHDDSVDPLAEYRKVNVDGTLNLARQAAEAGVRRFVFMSSVKVNGEETPDGNAFRETDIPNPQDPYGVSKWEAEQGLAKIAAQTGMQCVVVRPPLVYGPGVKANFRALMHAVARGLPLPLGAIYNQRSLVALDNLIDFVVTCLSHPAAANQTFLVSDGRDLSTTQLVRGLAHALGRRPLLLPLPAGLLMGLGQILGKGPAVRRLCGNLRVDSSKARQLLGWTPPVTVEVALARTVAK